jgi:chromosomal replication initiation ATPase DnaA
MTRQLPLPLAWTESDSAGDFYRGPSNDMALAWLERGPSAWGHHASLLIGPAKSGKTHLARMFAARFAGTFVPLHRSGTAQGSGVFIIDDLGPGVDEVSLFHTYNRLKEQGGTLLMIARTQPRDWPVTLPDLASRLAATPQVEIGAPDDAILGAVMIKQLKDKGWSVPPDVVSYLLPRMERSFEGVHRLVGALDEQASGLKRNLTVILASNVLKNIDI